MNSKARVGYLIVLSLLLQLSGPQRSVLADQAAVQKIATDAFANAYLVADPERSSLRAYLIFNQGEIHNPGTEGLAHYVEHLAWLNTQKDSGSSRHSNAWSNLYSTGYWVDFDSTDHEHQLKSLLRVVDPFTLDEKFMLEERAVIEQEYTINSANNPYLPFNLERGRALLGDNAFARSVIGTPDAIRQFDLAEARRWHQQSHQLKNATLLVIGKHSAEQLALWLDAMDLPSVDQQVSGSKLPGINLPPIDDERDFVSENVPDSTFYLQKLVEFDDCDSPARCDAVFRLLESAIDSLLPGGIANALRFDNFIARSFTFDLYQVGKSHAVLSFTAQPDAGVSLEKLQDAFMDAWSATADGGIPEETVERVRKRILDDMNVVVDKPAHALAIALDQLSRDEPVYSPEEQISALKTVDYGEVMNLLQKLQGDGRLVVRRVARAGE